MSAEAQAIKDFRVGASSIGEVANTAQLAQSQYTHMLMHKTVKDKFGRTYSDEEIKGMRELLYRANNAQGIAIDNAKRMSDLDLSQEMKDIKSSKYWIKDTYINAKGKEVEYIVKPSFFKNVQTQANEKTLQTLDCNMDMFNGLLKEHINEATGKGVEGLNIDEVLINIKRGQLSKKESESVKRAIEIINENNNKVNAIRSAYKNATKDELGDMYKVIETYNREIIVKINKTTLDQNAFKLLVNSAYKENSDVRSSILSALYKKNEEMFLNCFKEGEGIKTPSLSFLIESADISINTMHGEATVLINTLNDKVDEVVGRINKEIDNLVFKNMKANMTTDEIDKYLKRGLTKAEIEDMTKKWKAKGVSVTDLALLNTATRMTILEKNIAIETKYLYEVEKRLSDNLFKYNIRRQYDKAIKDLEKQLNVKLNYKELTDEQIEKMLNNKFLNQSFMERLQHDCNTYKGTSIDKFRSMIVGTDENGFWSIKEGLEGRANYMKMQNTRLLRTELTRFHNMATLEAYKSLGIEKYVYVAEHDSRTCNKCSSLDGLVFTIEDVIWGTNIPAIHPFCRCSIAPYLSDKFVNSLKVVGYFVTK